jgi:hypothetical protein
MDISAFLIGAILPNKIPKSLRWATITAVNDNDSGTYTNSEDKVSEGEVERWVAKNPGLDWRKHVNSGIGK